MGSMSKSIRDSETRAHNVVMVLRSREVAPKRTTSDILTRSKVPLIASCARTHIGLSRRIAATDLCISGSQHPRSAKFVKSDSPMSDILSPLVRNPRCRYRPVFLVLVPRPRPLAQSHAIVATRVHFDDDPGTSGEWSRFALHNETRPTLAVTLPSTGTRAMFVDVSRSR